MLPLKHWRHILTFREKEPAWTWGESMRDCGHIVKVVESKDKAGPMWIAYIQITSYSHDRTTWGAAPIGRPKPGKGALYWHTQGKKLKFGQPTGKYAKGESNA